MAGLEGGAHNTDVTGAVEGVVAATVGHLDEMLLDALAVELGRVDEVGGTELAGPGLLAVVHIDGDDLAGLVLHTTLDDRETNAAGTEDGNVGALLDLGGDGGSAVTGRDTAAQQAGAVEGSLGGDGDDGDVGHDGVLREGGSAHEVQDVLAAGPEACGPIGHDTATLGGSDLTAEVGLSGLAELALAALGGAASVSNLPLRVDGRTAGTGVVLESNNVVTGLHVGDALSNRLDDTGTLVAEDDGEGTLGVLSGERVRI